MIKKEMENKNIETETVVEEVVETEVTEVAEEKVTLKQKVGVLVKKHGKKIGAAVGVAGATIGGLVILAKALKGNGEETYSGADDFGYESSDETVVDVEVDSVE